jgi:hypothetical protein
MGLPLGLSSDADGWTAVDHVRDTPTNAPWTELLESLA